MKCQKCGQENMDWAKFCTNCGAPLDKPQQPTDAPQQPQYTQQPPYYAPQMPPAQQPPYYAQQPTYPQQPTFDGTYRKKKKKVWIPILLCALVLALVLGTVAIYFVFVRSNENLLAERFVEAVVLNDERAVARCFHPNMAQNAVREYANVVYGVDSCEAEAVKLEWMSRTTTREAQRLFADYEIDAQLESLWLVTVEFTLTSGGASYDAVAEIYVGHFDGGTYVLGGEPMYRVENP